jgi:hypothetical protein
MRIAPPFAAGSDLGNMGTELGDDCGRAALADVQKKAKSFDADHDKGIRQFRYTRIYKFRNAGGVPLAEI